MVIKNKDTWYLHECMPLYT